MQAAIIAGVLALVTAGSAGFAQDQTAAAGDPDKGKALFDQCAACHSLDGDQNDLGPTLHGLFGRPTASIDGFEYSGPMRRANTVWTPQTLDAFLADPQAPPFKGNRMPFSGLPDAADRRDLIAYLQQAAQ